MCTLSAEEEQEFENVFHLIVRDLEDNPIFQGINPTLQWLQEVLLYNVHHGKKIRGKTVPITLKCMKGSPSAEELKGAYIAGWCIEILQASLIISDDIMDKSETRRGKPCWYKVENMGVIALNDSFLLEQVLYQILKKYFETAPYYCQLLQLFLDVTCITICGQSLDTKTGENRSWNDLTMENFKMITKHKTAHYTIYLPLAVGLLLSGEIFTQMKEAESVSLQIGEFFQIQDDFLDCFGDESTTGKVGTDIQDFKCSWIVATAKELCSQQQLRVLQDNYGEEDPVRVTIVKDLFVTLGIPQLYKMEEENGYKDICKGIGNISNSRLQTVCYYLINEIYNRSK